MIHKYTIVQHSAYGYGNKWAWDKAVESREVQPRDAALVATVGGLLYNDYSEAENAAERFNHPEGVEGLQPQVQGTFSNKKIDGLAIYLPAVGER